MPERVGLAALNISCQRGSKVLFEDFSFALAPGEGLLVTGPNGAGKTSLLRQIAGLLPLAAGLLSLEGPRPDVELPELEVGDRVYVMNAGAYTLSYASSFNGFEAPAVHFLSGVSLPR